ncbi:pep-cterm sorting domain-containing protein [Anaeramoeba flamelloides]|uniref:Pep-cterm sorting domain-containing protein n=1 Tax=Anaeramoeba flamelloides TaxID=1746091 RepID=A0ABQ8YY48_9EUKA|nr:pep-cterm sorting domain-containing protein [Anaeramoeba flamelloides]
MQKLLMQYINNKDLADLEFRVGKKETIFYGHKFLIGLVSDFWYNKLYKEGWQTKTKKGRDLLQLPKLDPILFELFLEYVYTREVAIKSSLLFDLQKKADQYGVPQLKKQFSEKFIDNIDLTNCLHFYEYAIGSGVKEWVSDVKKFISINTEIILMKKDCFEGLREDTIKEILSFENFLSPEIQIFRALRHWAQKRVEKMGSTTLLSSELQNKSKVTVKTLLKGFSSYIKLDYMNFQDLVEVHKAGVYDVETLFHTITGLAIENDLKLPLFTRSGPQLPNMKVLFLAVCRGGKPKIDHIVESISSGSVGNVSHHNIIETTPTFEKMNEYDAIVVRSRNGEVLNDPTTLGNNLAKFVETGKGVVVMAINSLVNYDGIGIQGRFIDEGFVPLQVGERIEQDERELGEIHLPTHPIMKGVETFKTKNYTHLIGTHEINSGNLIASWNNGYPLITEKTKQGAKYGSVVCLNFHPCSTKITDNCGKAWLQETDGAKIISNSVEFVLRQYMKKIEF